MGDPGAVAGLTHDRVRSVWAVMFIPELVLTARALEFLSMASLSKFNTSEAVNVNHIVRQSCM